MHPDESHRNSGVSVWRPRPNDHEDKSVRVGVEGEQGRGEGCRETQRLSACTWRPIVIWKSK